MFPCQCLFFQAESYKFLSAGREDVDVRMLGTGRPFAFECVNAKRTKFSNEELMNLARKISKIHPGVAVNSLRVMGKDDISILKKTENKKQYTALCVTKTAYNLEQVKKLESMTDVELKQETPIRVLHRRSNDTRPKIVHSMSVTPVTETMFKLGVVTSAGTYVKELVSF